MKIIENFIRVNVCLHTLDLKIYLNSKDKYKNMEEDKTII